VPKPSSFEVQIAIAKLKKYKLPGTGEIPSELIQAQGETLWSESINALIQFGVWENCLISGRSLLLY
jgi:hypothetical protein